MTELNPFKDNDPAIIQRLVFVQLLTADADH